MVRPNNNEIVLIVQTINYGKYLGLLQLTFDDDGKITNYEGNPVLLDSSVEQGMTSQIIKYTRVRVAFVRCTRGFLK